MFACLVLDDEKIKKLPGFYKRTQWFLKNRKDLSDQVRIAMYMYGEERVCHNAINSGVRAEGF
jgi:hypothetical protein